MKLNPGGSITGWLILMLTIGTSVLWLTAAIISSGILRHELNESFDHALVETAHRLLPLAMDSVQDRDEGADVHEIHHFEEDHDGGLVYQLSLKGRMLLRSDDAPDQLFEAEAVPGFSDTPDYRVFTMIDKGTGLAIQVGEPVLRRQRGLMGSTMSLFLPLLLLIPLSIVGIWLAVRIGLRPLNRLQGEIAARDSANLAPLETTGLPRELTPIATALSRLIDRLRAALEAERQFAANSAHELRTPIAGALAQTQRLIETSTDERARAEGRRIESTLRRLADLAEKLMQLARADAGIAVTAEPIAIVPVLRLVLADTEAHIRGSREVKLVLGPGAEEFRAEINVDALGIVLRNLVDNAVAHSPPESPIEIEVESRRIHVRNHSPIVAPAELERLRRRFERGATSARGSGLGLAIVDTILGQVGGKLQMHSPIPGTGDGFEAILDLP